MKKIIWGMIGVLIASDCILLSFVPDTLSLIVLGCMSLTIFMGIYLFYIPVSSLLDGFQNARSSIHEAMEVQAVDTWIALTKNEKFFRQKEMDAIFHRYKELVEQKKANHEIPGDLEENLNEEYLSLRVWQSLAAQIPGILTGLGILGTFVGLIFGISNVGFSSVEAALESIQTLLQGIEVAFYTSIAGVILSIIFNITYRISWNILLRECDLFMGEFHRYVIPSIEEQTRMKQDKVNKTMIELLERIPKNAGFSLSVEGDHSMAKHAASEQIMMPQIQAGLKKKEFTFYLQPKVNLSTRTIVAAESLARWNHEKLGLLSPSMFIPIIERNGYITKLDCYLWELVCITLRDWIDRGLRPVPVSVNISKTDILAMDVVGFWEEMLQKYQIPPRMLEIEIARSSYIQSPEATKEVEKELRIKGFKVLIDGFDGDFVSMNMLDGIEADGLKLDMRFLEGVSYDKLFHICAQARKLNIEVSAEGIENAEEVSNLKKAGYIEGQGYYFYQSMSKEEFEHSLKGNL